MTLDELRVAVGRLRTPELEDRMRAWAEGYNDAIDDVLDLLDDVSIRRKVTIVLDGTESVATLSAALHEALELGR